MSTADEKLSKEDIAKLAELFHLLMKMDERNKREGRYEKTRQPKNLWKKNETRKYKS